MSEALIVYHVDLRGEGAVLSKIRVVDFPAWVTRAWGDVSLLQKSAVDTMRRNAAPIFNYQARALRDGPVFLAPLKGEEVRQLGGDAASTVSRILTGAVVRCAGETFEAKYLISANALEDMVLSRVQARLLCMAARAVLGDLSDQKICDALVRAGVPIARRTVAHYRKTENERDVMPTRRLAAKFEATVAALHDEGDLKRLVTTMVEHNHRQLALVEHGGDPSGPRCAELRKLLIDGGFLGSEVTAQFEGLDAGEQRRVLDAVLATLDTSVREAVGRKAAGG